MGKSTINKDKLNDLTLPITVDAGDVSVTPAGNLSATDVQTALVELQGDIDGVGGGSSGLVGLVHNILGTATYDVSGNIAVISSPTPSYSTAVPGTTSNLELDSVYAQPFAVVDTMTFERIGVRVLSSYDPAANQAFIRYLIWEERSATDRRPGTLVYDSAAFELPDTTVATGKDRYAWHTFSTPFEFEAGKQYWLGVVFSLSSGSYPSIRVGTNGTVCLGFHMGNDNAATIHVRLSGAVSNPGFNSTSGNDSSDYGTGFYIIFALQT